MAPGDLSGGGGLAGRLTPRRVRDEFDRLLATRADCRVTNLILAGRVWEWVHAVGVTVEPTLRALVPPFPPIELRQIVSDHQLEMFLWTGFLDALQIGAIIDRHVPRERPRILDFGAGCGRVARFIASADAPPEVVAADVNPDHVSWCGKSLAVADVIVASESPPLPFEDDEFDCVYTISVMTHLDRDRAAAWKAELQRVTKRSGVIILTTHGYPVLDRIEANATLQDYFRMPGLRAADIRRRLGAEGHLFEGYDHDVLDKARAGSAYGVSFTDPAFLRTWWSSGGTTVIEHEVAGLRGWQDLIVLKKDGG